MSVRWAEVSEVNLTLRGNCGVLATGCGTCLEAVVAGGKAAIRSRSGCHCFERVSVRATTSDLHETSPK